jgi:hypothetical protein
MRVFVISATILFALTSFVLHRTTPNLRPKAIFRDALRGLAHLGVARANALQGRTLQGQGQGADADAARVRALAAYKDFLTIWKDADPDIPS